MPTLLDYFLKFLGLAIEIGVILAWLYAYMKTKLKGIAFIALSVIIGFLGWLVLALLTVATPISLITLRYILPIFSVTSFLVLVYGIRMLVRELSQNL